MLQLAIGRDNATTRRAIFLDIGQTSATTILSLVNDLLEISAVESGRFPWWKSSLIQGGIRCRFCAIFKNPKAGWMNLEFSYRIDDMVPLAADRRRGNGQGRS
jgi:signal transduction histidine kinase